MAEGHRPESDFEGEQDMEHDNRESWLNRVAIGMAPLFAALDGPMQHEPLDSDDAA